ncbi:MAG TPA: hypothetical protein VD790_01700 [Thermoleophilaceae bacterium]|nr:hypothetical protein [Thermoleophilaceae bacterium]
MRRLRQRLSYSNVIATIALFAALGGGAYAAVQLSKDSVGAKQIRKNAVRAAEIKKNAVRGPDVRNGSLDGEDFGPGELPAGATGPQGPPGPTASASFSATPDIVLGASAEVGSTQITTDFDGRIMANASVMAAPDGSSNDQLRCSLSLGGNSSGAFDQVLPDTGVGADRGTLALSHGAELPAGTREVRVTCDSVAGQMTVERVSIIAWAVAE